MSKVLRLPLPRNLLQAPGPATNVFRWELCEARLESTSATQLEKLSMTPTDHTYTTLLAAINETGETISSRNGPARRKFDLFPVTFTRTPLVTVRKTAWAKAIREMEWFLSGEAACPAELLDWWKPQLNEDEMYIAGYGKQLRSFMSTFDQIEALIDSLRHHPYSRRNVITTWNPAEMYNITMLNDNPNTPTTCHTTIAHFHVSQDLYLSFYSYQRSADMLLGVPHNWIQSWAFLLWLCEQTDKVPGKMIWGFGDAHVYQEESHLRVLDQIIALKNMPVKNEPFRLEYNGKRGDEFKAKDFEIIGNIPEPIVSGRPKLL